MSCKMRYALHEGFVEGNILLPAIEDIQAAELQRFNPMFGDGSEPLVIYHLVHGVDPKR